MPTIPVHSILPFQCSSPLNPYTPMSEAQEETPPVPKRPKSLSGAAKYGSKFNPDCQLEYPFALPGHIDKVYSFYCSLCMKTLAVVIKE